MSASLNNVTAPDAYEEADAVRAPGSTRLFLSINNQAIYFQLGFGIGGGAVDWSEEEKFRPPGLYELDVACDAVRVRAAVPAASVPAPLQQAQVSVTLE